MYEGGGKWQQQAGMETYFQTVNAGHTSFWAPTSAPWAIKAATTGACPPLAAYISAVMCFYSSTQDTTWGSDPTPQVMQINQYMHHLNRYIETTLHSILQQESTTPSTKQFEGTASQIPYFNSFKMV